MIGYHHVLMLIIAVVIILLCELLPTCLYEYLECG